MHAKSAMVEEKSDGLVNGIDLGTTYSRVDIFKNGHVEFTPIDQSNRITPSHVAFTKQEHLIGEPAKNQAIINPSQTLFDVTRLIDWRFMVPTAQTDVKLMPFKTVDKEINHAVATAPAHYNDAQRQPTKDAGTTSGMVITYTEIANETKSMLVKAGWNKDFFVNTTPVKPSLGWMGNLLKKSGNMVCGVGFKNSQR